MARYHPAAEMAPRDVVARAIDLERRAGRGAFLDARAAVGEAFPHEFPFVFARCRDGGIDPRVQPIPVLPAAHYHMGGVATDLLGATSLHGLWAAGECASVGVHGANRLASNSLLEAAVFGHRAGTAAREAAWLSTRPLSPPLPPDLAPDQLASLREHMSRDAGVARDAAGLTRLIEWLSRLDAAHGAALPLIAARLVAEAALDRRESRGAHGRVDFPAADGTARHSARTLETPATARRRAA
jgi:L-aspartate oxidase